MTLDFPGNKLQLLYITIKSCICRALAQYESSINGPHLTGPIEPVLISLSVIPLLQGKIKLWC